MTARAPGDLYRWERSWSDQWIALMVHPSTLRVRTISSAPVEFTVLPRYRPRVVLVALVQATSPRTLTRTGDRVAFNARAKAMSAGR